MVSAKDWKLLYHDVAGIATPDSSSRLQNVIIVRFKLDNLGDLKLCHTFSKHSAGGQPTIIVARKRHAPHKKPFSRKRAEQKRARPIISEYNTVCAPASNDILADWSTIFKFDCPLPNPHRLLECARRA